MNQVSSPSVNLEGQKLIREQATLVICGLGFEIFEATHVGRDKFDNLITQSLVVKIISIRGRLKKGADQFSRILLLARDHSLGLSL